MDNRKNLPCSKCGEMMWRSRTSAPEGKATCRPCRNAKPKTSPPAVETWSCAGCGQECSRPRTKGTRPKWCDSCRTRGVWNYNTFTCAGCGAVVTASGTRFCSITCFHQSKPPRPAPPKPVRPPVDMRTPLRRAYESQDWAGVLTALEERAIKVDGCWLWPSKSRDGYGVVAIAGRSFGVHRVAMSAHLGQAIPSHHPVHHRCAEGLCFNPEHLQVVTPHENNAEMLERRYYLKRIAELEAALRRRAPNHPLVA